MERAYNACGGWRGETRRELRRSRDQPGTVEPSVLTQRNRRAIDGSPLDTDCSRHRVPTAQCGCDTMARAETKKFAAGTLHGSHPVGKEYDERSFRRTGRRSF
jgi:hypothetical protein